MVYRLCYRSRGFLFLVAQEFCDYKRIMGPWDTMNYSIYYGGCSIQFVSNIYIYVLSNSKRLIVNRLQDHFDCAMVMEYNLLSHCG